MPGHHIVAAQNLSPAEQRVKFQMPVAVNTGVGGQSLFVAFYEFLNDLFPEGILKIEHIVGNPQTVSHAPGIFGVVQGTAGALFRESGGGVVVQAHGGADAGISRLKGQQGCHRAVHTAAHANQGLFLTHTLASWVRNLLSTEYTDP